MICSGCLTTGTTPRKLAVALPAAPAYMAPVAEPAIAAGTDARLAFRKTRTALRNANGRLSASAGWYKGVRVRYSGQ